MKYNWLYSHILIGQIVTSICHIYCYLTIIFTTFKNIFMNYFHVRKRKILHFVVEKCKNLEYIKTYTTD